MEGLKMKYFVLNPESKHQNDEYAKASRSAMIAYAISITKVNPVLANDLTDWVRREEK